MNLVSDVQVGYLAGFVDGSGCIDIHKLRKKSGVIYYLPRLRLSNKRRTPLEFIKKSFGLKEKINKRIYSKGPKLYSLSINKQSEIERILLLIKDILQKRRKRKRFN